MSSEDETLTLGLGFSSSSLKTHPNYYNNHLNQQQQHHHLKAAVKNPPVSLTLSLSGETYQRPPEKKIEDQPPCSGSAASSFSNATAHQVVVSAAVKRERETVSSEDLEVEMEMEMEMERGSNSRASDEDEDGSAGPTTTATRKKLRLTKDQSALLEDSFKQQSTLNPKQKLALADRLNLRPRQVEVWFQNRRARTKLKQTEVDCEYLKKCCETLTEENRRLQKELQELKALKLGQAAAAMYMQVPAATLTMCPSCERIAASSAAATLNPIGPGPGPGPSSGPTTTSKIPFIMGPKAHFYAASFSNSSAASLLI